MRLTYEDKASIKLDRQQKNINPVDYAVWGALQQDVYRVLITIVIQYSLGALILW